ncbi:glutamyl-tRNA reductase [Deinococcus irradiatisoli]|uniref:Glutamyl-tRNA reductase n=1 Tax=Deinococcus irradiatisoli TaxID=2202254 RepID=A0A2Z3JEX9_9DEIO|nr:glutamyl-tRNA reductase [Deinococcus irradiatisoli]AWN23525.1 glutamyl-tRNA reductase [Deinococcus irradiatisoli]
MSLNLAVVGLNHTTAPVEVRERAAVREDEREAVLAHLRRHAREVMLLATCNRTEVYLAGIEGDPLSAFEGAWGQFLHGHLYAYEGEAAARHLYRVASGLDSLVIGETQIQGQVKRAWQDASQRGDTSALLNKAAQGALNAGKRVRHETGLSDKVVSVSSAAVELAEQTLGDLSGRTALIVGAGETAELTLIHLKAAGVRDIIVVNRTAERARQLAEKLGGRACAHEYLHEVLPEADVVIASSAAPHYVLGASGVQAALQDRPERPMMLIDISVPRILNPDIAGLEGAHLYNLDDLQGVVSRNLASRRAALPRAGEIVDDAVADLLRWQAFRESRGLHRPALLRQAEHEDHRAHLLSACD